MNRVFLEHGQKSDGKGEVFSVSVHKGLINQIEHLGRSFAAKDTAHYNLVRPGDIVYTKSPTGDFPYGIVKQSHLSVPVIVSPLYGVFTPANKHLGRIVDAFFESPARAYQFLDSITQKGAKNTIQISHQTFLSKGIFLPNTQEEQELISNFLSNTDQLIAINELLLSQLKEHKSGLLQRLFPRPERIENGVTIPAETTPRLRFPAFANSASWPIVPLSKVLSEHKRKSDGNSAVHSVAVVQGLVDQIEHLGRSYSAEDTSHYNLVLPNDVVYTKSPTGKYPFGIVKQSHLAHRAIVSPLYGVFTPSSHAVGYLIASYFDSPVRARFFLEPISKKGAKNTIQITNSTFLSGQIALPPTVQEAEKIVRLLRPLDDLISAQTKKIELLKTHKRGLLQGLFPVLEAT